MYWKPIIFLQNFPFDEIPLGKSQCKHMSELIFTHPPIYFASPVSSRAEHEAAAAKGGRGGEGGREGGDQTHGPSLTLIPVLASTFADPLLPGTIFPLEDVDELTWGTRAK